MDITTNWLTMRTREDLATLQEHERDPNGAEGVIALLERAGWRRDNLR